MKNLKRVLFLFIVVFLTLTACKKEEITDVTDKTPPTPTQTNSNPLVNRMAATDDEDGITLACFVVNFDFGLDVGGNVFTISSGEDFENALEAAAADSSSIDFVYPLNVTYEDGNSGTIHNAEELAEAFAACVPDIGWTDFEFPAYVINDSCFTLVYPLSVQNQDGVAFTVENEDAFTDLLASGEYYGFVFPISLTDSENTVHEVANNDELTELLLSCDYGDGYPVDTLDGLGLGVVGCYDFVYPVSYIDANGEVQTAANLDEFSAALLSGDIVDFSYPLTLVEEGSDPITVTSEAEFGAALAACGDMPAMDHDLSLLFGFSARPDSTGNLVGCYTINYPVNVLHGTDVIVLGDEFAVVEEMANDIDAPLQYPVSVFVLENEQNLILESEGDLNTLIDNCH